MNKLIKIKDLCIAFDKNKEVVKNVSIEIVKGKTTAIVGESGSGKTLSALSILKLLPSSAKIKKGEIIYNNKNILNLSNSEIQKLRGNKISTIFQEPMSSLNPLHTINKQISEIILTHKKINKKDAYRKTLSLLHEVGLEDIVNRPKIYPYELSGGQRQRAMIAMSIANGPELLIADEPTTALDVTVQLQILDLLKQLQDKLEMSMLFISHDLSVVKKMADYVYVMKDGIVIENGTKEKIFNEPKNDYTKKLILSHSKIKIKSKFHKKEVLSIKNLNVWYPIKKGLFKKTVDYVKAVKDFSFILNEGECVGIVGESGSGKTSLILAILKLVKSQGIIRINNRNINLLNNNKILKLRKDIQIVFQDPFSSLSPRMNVEQIISEGLNIHFPNISENEKTKKLRNILFKVGLDYDDCINKYPHEFSGGQRQRICIARALILEPKILVLDEPTSALDVTIQNQIIELLIKLQIELNLSLIFISHDIGVIRSISDKIVVLRSGIIVESGTTKEVLDKPNSDYTRNLVSSVI